MTVTVDRRFGAPRKFGTSTKFGASSATAEVLAWGVEIDWDGDGDFDGSNEARYMVGIRGERGRRRYVTQSGEGFEHLMTGSYTITLDNQTGRYDAWNSASVLYPNVTYGKDVRLSVRNLEDATIYPVFFGVINDIRPVNSNNGEKRVMISIVDGWNYLRNYIARYAIQQDISPDEAIGFVLDSVSWPTRWGRALDVSADNIDYWWANGDKQAGSEIEDLTESFVGYFYISREGAATFKIRSNVGSSVADLTQDVLLKDVTLPQPWENSRNVTRISVHPRLAAASGVVYTLIGTPPSVPTGAANALTIFANYTYQNLPVPAINVITPLPTSDFLINAQADGLGADLTSDCTVTLTDFGDRAKLVITNLSGVTGYITFLQIRADALYEPNVSDVVYPDGSLPTQPREFHLDLLWQQDVNVAVDFTNVIGPFLDGFHPYPIVQLDNRPAKQFIPDLFDVITLSLDEFGIVNESYRVAYISHESMNENCQAIRTKFYLESYVPADDYWQWDTNSDFDVSTIFGA